MRRFRFRLIETAGSELAIVTYPDGMVAWADARAGR